jgi:hypothetical protein
MDRENKPEHSSAKDLFKLLAMMIGVIVVAALAMRLLEKFF